MMEEIRLKVYCFPQSEILKKYFKASVVKRVAVEVPAILKNFPFFVWGILIPKKDPIAPPTKLAAGQTGHAIIKPILFVFTLVVFFFLCQFYLHSVIKKIICNRRNIMTKYLLSLSLMAYVFGTEACDAQPEGQAAQAVVEMCPSGCGCVAPCNCGCLEGKPCTCKNKNNPK